MFAIVFVGTANGDIGIANGEPHNPSPEIQEFCRSVGGLAGE